MKVVVVGGVAGGASAAARLRRLNENAEIIIFERTGFVSYANCGLPYYIGGVIEDPEELTLQTPESFKSRFRIDVRVRHEVQSIDREKKTVSVTDLDSGVTFEESYDYLILSPGAKPLHPDLPGIDNENIFTLRTVEDTFRIRSFVVERKPKSAAIIGGGFIGIEMAENLCDMGIKVTMIQRPKQLLNTLDSDMASFVHGKLRSKGVDLVLGGNVTGFSSSENYECLSCKPAGIGGNIAAPVSKKSLAKVKISIKDRPSVMADMVIMAIGVQPDSSLAKDAGLKLGLKDSIVVNDNMLTSDPYIYAVGDAIEVRHFVSGKEAVISLAGPANKQGRIAADNICGIKSRYQGSQGSSVIKVFDMTAASTGLTEKSAKASGIDCDSVVLSPQSHAGYYPGATALTMKVVFEKNTYRLLGAQVVGKESADKRIDVLATSIRAGLKAYELKDLDLAYAPPYASAKDPVNMAGFMIENIKEGLVKQYHYEDVEPLVEKKLRSSYASKGEPECSDKTASSNIKEPYGSMETDSNSAVSKILVNHSDQADNETFDKSVSRDMSSVSSEENHGTAGHFDCLSGDEYILLDTRTTLEYQRGHVNGFRNIPVDELRDRLHELDKTKTIFVMCQSGLRSYIAYRILSQSGFDCYNFAGGYRFYEAVSTDKLQSEDIFPCGMVR